MKTCVALPVFALAASLATNSVVYGKPKPNMLDEFMLEAFLCAHYAQGAGNKRESGRLLKLAMNAGRMARATTKVVSPKRPMTSFGQGMAKFMKKYQRQLGLNTDFMLGWAFALTQIKAQEEMNGPDGNTDTSKAAKLYSDSNCISIR